MLRLLASIVAIYLVIATALSFGLACWLSWRTLHANRPLRHPVPELTPCERDELFATVRAAQARERRLVRQAAVLALWTPTHSAVASAHERLTILQVDAVVLARQRTPIPR